MEILTDEQIEYYLNELRNTLTNYDFSDVSNLLFFDIESFSYYLNNTVNNPFEMQYQEIESILTLLSPYIGTSIPSDIMELFEDLGYEISYNNILTNNLFLSAKLDFLDRIKSTESQRDWLLLIDECIHNKNHLINTMQFN